MKKLKEQDGLHSRAEQCPAGQRIRRRVSGGFKVQLDAGSHLTEQERVYVPRRVRDCDGSQKE